MTNRIVRALSPRGETARFVLAALLAGVLSAACGSDPVTAPRVLSSIVVTPVVTLAITATQQFMAVGKDAAGAEVTITPTWSITGGGTISEAGLFAAGTEPGTFTSTVMATSGGISGSASVTVINGAVGSIAVTPNPVKP